MRTPIFKPALGTNDGDPGSDHVTSVHVSFHNRFPDPLEPRTAGLHLTLSGRAL